MSDDQLRLQLTQKILSLSPDQLIRVAQFVHDFEKPILPRPSNESKRDWPHAPIHRLSEHGTYLVTAGTLYKEHHFFASDRLDYLESKLLEFAVKYGWQIEAWAVFSNHYHFVAHSDAHSTALKVFLGHLHTQTAKWINEIDGVEGRQVWHNFWETRLTFERSYLARLNYVHQNAVKHGLVSIATQYPWCSAAWFDRTATPAQVRTIASFRLDQVRVFDEFDVLTPTE